MRTPTCEGNPGNDLIKKKILFNFIFSRMSARISQAILDLLHQRAPGKSICPSEIARQLFSPDWREHMEEVRQVAFDMTRAGEIRVTQGDDEIDPDGPMKGPIRLRLPKNENA